MSTYMLCVVCCAAAEILEGALPPAFHSRLAYLSGPSFAAEVARELPTVVTIAAKVRDLPCKHSQQGSPVCRQMLIVHAAQQLVPLKSSASHPFLAPASNAAHFKRPTTPNSDPIAASLVGCNVSACRMRV